MSFGRVGLEPRDNTKVTSRTRCDTHATRHKTALNTRSGIFLIPRDGLRPTLDYSLKEVSFLQHILQGATWIEGKPGDNPVLRALSALLFLFSCDSVSSLAQSVRE